MAYKVGIITIGRKIAKDYKEQIEYCFRDVVEITTYSINDKTAFNLNKEDLYLITAIQSDHFELIIEQIKKIDAKSKIIIGNLAFEKSAIETLKNIKSNTVALLVNVNFKMSMETITMLHQSGINNIEFKPYYPNCPEVEVYDIIVTPNEQRHMPPSDKPIIDIGNRLFDANTITDIAVKLNCEYILEYKHIKKFFEKLAGDNFALNNLLRQNSVLSHKFSILANEINKAVISTDQSGIVTNLNSKAMKLVGSNMIGVNISKKIPDIPFDTVKQNRVAVQTVMSLENDVFTTKTFPIFTSNIYGGAIVIIDKVDKKSAQGFIENEKLIKKGHIAKYRFSDIIGESEKMLEAKEIAKTMSKSHSPVLICGESGTGKELFAHAIHNASPRSIYPFVAINCAAIPDNLLESELFGYEEGSFTGAKKGGKIGLFEISNKGTLFLDEIEGMSKILQVKLLRVIQEGQVMRIGGDEIIDVDVRIVTATNEKLTDMIDKNEFREDLYYRICTLPITIPPLRERKGDVLHLFNLFRQRNFAKFILTADAKNFLTNYEWKGNVRELQNCVEYLSCIGEEIINTNNFPEFMKTNIHNSNLVGREYDDKCKNEYTVIKTIKLLKSNRKSCGRSSIYNELKGTADELTLSQIRTILNKLVQKGFLISSAGPRGMELSAEAYSVFKL